MTRNQEDSHRGALAELLQFKAPVSELGARVRSFPYDYAGPSVPLTRGTFVQALQRFQRGELSAKDLEVWADLIEGRPGIEFDEADEDILSKVLFHLSTPDINGALTPEKVGNLLGLLESRSIRR